MNPKELLTTLAAAGGAVKLDGERLLFTAPKSWTRDASGTFLAQLREEKESIMAYLAAEERGPVDAHENYCAGCYEIGPNVRIHPPRGRTL